MPTIRPNVRHSDTDAYLHLRMMAQLEPTEAQCEATVWGVLLVLVLAGGLTVAVWLWCLN